MLRCSRPQCSSMIRMTAGSISLIRPPGGTSNRLSRSPSRHSSASCMTVTCGGSNALLLADLHLPAFGPELLRQWQLEGHPCTPSIMTPFVTNVKRTFSSEQGPSVRPYCCRWPGSASFLYRYGDRLIPGGKGDVFRPRKSASLEPTSHTCQREGTWSGPRLSDPAEPLTPRSLFEKKANYLF